MPSKGLYRLRREQGLCVECGGELDNNLSYCNTCRDKRIVRRKKREVEYIKIGLCRCGKRLYGSERNCIDCRTSNSNYKSLKLSMMTEEEKAILRKKNCEYQKARQKLRKDAGLCVVCGKPNNNGKTKCNFCNAKFNQYQLDRKARLGLYAEPRKENECLYCRKPICKNSKLCKECYDKACTNTGRDNSNHTWRRQNAGFCY